PVERQGASRPCRVVAVDAAPCDAPGRGAILEGAFGVERAHPRVAGRAGARRASAAGPAARRAGGAPAPAAGAAERAGLDADDLHAAEGEQGDRGREEPALRLHHQLPRTVRAAGPRERETFCFLGATT